MFEMKFRESDRNHVEKENTQHTNTHNQSYLSVSFTSWPTDNNNEWKKNLIWCVRYK